MIFEVEIAVSALTELKSIKRFYRQPIIDAIDTQLGVQPLTETKNRKLLHGLAPDFEHIPPVWEFRVGAYRIFYDVVASEQRLIVRAIREKPPHLTTEDIV